MRMIKFSAIYLLSSHERAATSVTFESDVTVLKAPNGWGKSGVLKSLYDTFGAQPHRVDQSWRNARVASAVEFTVDGKPYSILKYLNSYAVFSESGDLLLRTSSVSDELTPFLAHLLDFKLRMADKKEQIVVPPPAYMFAPYYIDQDKSWTTQWAPFQRLYLPNSAKTLIEYHSGLKPNAYYELLAEKELLYSQMKSAQELLKGLQGALEHLSSSEGDSDVHLRLEDFKEDTERLVTESKRLMEVQSAFRGKLAQMLEVRSLWRTQLGVTRAALAESDSIFQGAVDLPHDVDCPTCGQHYDNDITARFSMAADSGALLMVVNEAEGKIKELDQQISEQQSEVEALAVAHKRIEALLGIRRNEITLGEILRSEGRNEAAKSVRVQIKGITAEVGEITLKIKDAAQRLQAVVDKRRSKEIREHFLAQLADAATRLDVRVPEKFSINNTTYARGSEGPRGIAAYFYSFLQTTRKYGSSAFCPIIIDAPNQQGQDAEHLPAILSYLLERRPDGAQIILGVENVFEVVAEQRSFREIGTGKRALLDGTQYDRVYAYLRPKMAHLVDAIL